LGGEQGINADYIERFCNTISLVLDSLTFEEKRSILREVIEKIEVRDDEISIWGIIPMQEKDIEDDKVSIASISS